MRLSLHHSFQFLYADNVSITGLNGEGEVKECLKLRLDYKKKNREDGEQEGWVMVTGGEVCTRLMYKFNHYYWNYLLSDRWHIRWCFLCHSINPRVCM